MARRIDAHVEPALLVWARESAGLEIVEAARKASVKPQQVNEWECGAGKPTINQLRSLARAYKRPLAVFFLPRPPRDFTPLHDYRRLPEVQGAQLSPELRFEVRQAHSRREEALELGESLGWVPEPMGMGASLHSDPEEVGAQIRDLLGVSVEAQTQWAHERVAFNRWRSAIENVGVLVFQASDVETAEMRGFSIVQQPLPAVVVNVKDAYAGRTFSMLHEFAHILLATGGLCDLEESEADGSAEYGTEVFCNHVAAATLMPWQALVQEPLVSRNRSFTEWPDQDTRRLANRYGVSREAVLRRLLTFGRVSQSHYRLKRDQFQREYHHWRASRKRGYRDWAREPLVKAGRSFVVLVMRCHNEGKITLTDVSQLLGVQSKFLANVEAELRLSQGA